MSPATSPRVPIKATGIVECLGLAAVCTTVSTGVSAAVSTVLDALAAHDVNTQLLVQVGGCDGHAHLLFCVQDCDLRSALATVAEALPGCSTSYERGVAVLAVHGPHFRERSGCAATATLALAAAGVTVHAISTSVSSVAFVVPADAVKVAVATLRAAFEVPSGGVVVAADGISRPAR
ncbi:MAG: ACT domain-containing protein [Thermoanaerobaculaceae bacterium]